jgi:glycosyltransferase involved in cell wall biosynthesis
MNIIQSKISIITPTFNSERDLEACILSVAKQDYKNKEHLIIDGLSNDKTVEIVKKYSKIYPNIKWISEKDGGIYDAMNKGIDMAEGNWLYFLGSDDLLRENVLSEIFNEEKINENDVIYGDVIFENSDIVYDGKFDLIKIMEKNICQQAIFFKRVVFEKLGKFKQDYNIAADWEFNMRWMNDQDISHQYIDIIVAIYGEGGASSNGADSIFIKDKDAIIESLFPREFNNVNVKLNSLNAEIGNLNQLLLLKDKEIGNLKKLLLLKDEEIERGNNELHTKENLVVFMQSSKFWKLREMSFKVKYAFFHPLSFLKKYLKKAKRLFKKATFSLKQEGVLKMILRILNYIIFGKGVLNRGEIINRMKGVNFGESGYDLKKLDYNFSPKVSVIVPNYNHEKFLRQRLDSIYSQVYSNYEVILLDDNSSDNSREILIEYASKYKENTRYIFNESNSGSVFNQWKLGIEEAVGDFIWIAESDDYCSDNFISSLLPFLSDESVMIAYCRSIFEKGGENVWDIESYLAEIDQNKWKTDFIETANNIVNAAMAKKNIIPNMSSVIFRNPGKMNLLDNEKWKTLRFCGDWVFYLHIMRGGAIAYTTKATNYYRQHDKNTSTKLQSDDIYYIEHEFVAETVAELYAVSSDIFDSQKKVLKDYWKLWRKTYSDDDFNRCYDIEKIKNHQKNRKPNIAMFGYSFAAGGGETFPIILANILHENGYGVTFINCDRDARVEGVRKMLKQSIPVIKLTDISKIPLFVNAMGIEILHSQHAWVDSTINHMIKNMPRCKHIVTLHGMYEMTEESILEEILPRLNANVDKWVYTTDKNVDAFKRFKYFNEYKFVKIGNALVRSDIKLIPRETLGIKDDAFVLCLVSRSVPEKGWEEAIRCVRQARKQSGRDIQLVIIGDGKEKERLEGKAAKYIHFLGFKSNIRDYYAMSDMGFLPSRFKGESFPLTIIDCFFAGKPMLASHIAEIENMLKVEEGKYAGALFDLNDWIIPEKELTELIIRCATDIEYYNAMLLEVDNAASKFDINNVFLKYCECYDKLFDIGK